MFKWGRMVQPSMAARSASICWRSAVMRTGAIGGLPDKRADDDMAAIGMFEEPIWNICRGLGHFVLQIYSRPSATWVAKSEGRLCR